jgi:ATPase subunit of ABC transporter with duplicated ATPase domains
VAASLIARSLTVTRGPLLVLDRVDVTLAPGDRIGLVGPNGVGKSTLLQALAGRIDLDGGTVTLAPATATVGFMPQEPDRSPTESVREYLARRTGVAAAQRALDAATADLALGVDGADDRYANALDRWLALGAADFDARTGEVVADIGLVSRVLDQPTASLSGGEAARVTLASLLLSRHDLFLLDEPTNDLDLDGLDRLEEWVLDLESPALLVSHDRAFLSRTITDVIEIDPRSRRATRFGGGWDAFGVERERARDQARRRFEEYDTKRRALAGRAQREREWAQQGLARVRRTDEPDKNIRHFKTNQTEQLAARAARTERAMERLEVVEAPWEPWELRLTIPTTARSGTVVARANGAVVRRAGFTLGPVDVEIRYGDRVAIVGPNGSGKTTLLQLLMGRVAPDEGSATCGAGVVVGEIEQARGALLGDDSLLTAFMAATGSTVPDARTLLAKFGLGADHVVRPAGSLSPGERTRASLALVMANGANLLVLDEPTNHLDLEAIEQLELALDTFEGTVLLVTHDRALLHHVRITRTLELDRGHCGERA